MPSVRPASSVKLTPSTAANSPPLDREHVAQGPRLRAARVIAASRRARPGSARPRPRSTARSVMPAGRARARQAGEERLEALEALFVQAAQLGERLGVIVDAQVEERILLGRVDQQRRRLLAALVAAGRLARLQRGQQPLGERQRRRALVSRARSRRALAGPRACCRRSRNRRRARWPHQSMHAAAGVRGGAPLRDRSRAAGASRVRRRRRSAVRTTSLGGMPSASRSRPGGRRRD